MKEILSSLLSQNMARQSDFQKVLWLVDLIKWIQRPRAADEKNTNTEIMYTVRLKYILAILSKNPEWKNNFIETIGTALVKISSATQLSRTGFSNQGFIQDFIHRLQEKILPKSPLSENLEALIDDMFQDEDEVVYIDFIDRKVLTEMLDLFSGQEALHLKLKKDILSASYMLSVQLLNGVLSIRNELNYSDRSLNIMPEFILEGQLRECVVNLNLCTSDEVSGLIVAAEKNTEVLYSSMHTQGVKIELVYLFQMQKRKLRRLKLLTGFLNSEVSTDVNFRLFLSQLILDTCHQRSLKSFISENVSLLTERIVQSNSNIGEHYVAYTWSEFKKMFESATGGGAVTAVTVFIKLGLSKLGFVGFIKGLADSLNYSGSFLIIQIMGWTLATKQPSATAPFIASELLKSTKEARRSLVALLRTQFIAVIGNLSLVLPICFSVSFGFLYIGQPLMSTDHALDIFSSTDILGPSILFAAFTGVLLFLASLIAGWIENWIVVNQIVKRLQFSEKLINRIGNARTQRLAQFVENNSNALSANIVLGFLLGMTPQVAKFFGLGLDVRHVTLATGAFATALPVVLDRGTDFWPLLNSVLGILFIGMVNISVSFLLAFLLASISSKVKFSSFFKLFNSGMGLILSRPWLLVIPENDVDEKIISEEQASKIVV